ncbi:hypothetical protein M0802_010312 [Mischocyttarus mexicanus]|nr:hypothetical protein M0802_010312 [Mischocyttarus mexicanus]
MGNSEPMKMLLPMVGYLVGWLVAMSGPRSEVKWTRRVIAEQGHPERLMTVEQSSMSADDSIWYGLLPRRTKFSQQGFSRLLSLAFRERSKALRVYSWMLNRNNFQGKSNSRSSSTCKVVVVVVVVVIVVVDIWQHMLRHREENGKWGQSSSYIVSVGVSWWGESGAMAVTVTLMVGTGGGGGGDDGSGSSVSRSSSSSSSEW